jgi:hypothetical protein
VKTSSDIKHRTKKQELETARKALFLLNVLEKREEVRMRRMSDIGRLMNDLRYVKFFFRLVDLIIYLSSS